MSENGKRHFWLELCTAVSLAVGARILGRVVPVFQEIFKSFNVEPSPSERILIGLVPFFHFAFPCFAGVSLLFVLERLHWDGGVATRIRKWVAGLFGEFFGLDDPERLWAWLLRGTLLVFFLLFVFGFFVFFVPRFSLINYGAVK